MTKAGQPEQRLEELLGLARDRYDAATQMPAPERTVHERQAILIALQALIDFIHERPNWSVANLDRPFARLAMALSDVDRALADPILVPAREGPGRPAIAERREFFRGRIAAIVDKLVAHGDLSREAAARLAAREVGPHAMTWLLGERRRKRFEDWQTILDFQASYSGHAEKTAGKGGYNNLLDNWAHEVERLGGRPLKSETARGLARHFLRHMVTVGIPRFGGPSPQDSKQLPNSSEGGRD